jgi:hypothetical protein
LQSDVRGGTEPKASRAGLSLVREEAAEIALEFVRVRERRLHESIRTRARDAFVSRMLSDLVRLDPTPAILGEAWRLSCLDARRAFLRQQLPVSLDSGPPLSTELPEAEEATVGRDSVALVLRALHRVVPCECRVLRLRGLGMSFSEIAKRQRTNSSTARSRAAKGRSTAQALGLHRHLRT